ncbi:probable high-affinity zinc uptake system abc transporter protein [Fulvimarina pelagi HTCC2506]|uniref:High-affinity zinc uptake system protein ZnuA n=2 Tax=Fulvimarina pelagi TaxID=217511 RepID=Q0G2X6_9HYPH|nr:zinc ABC transporter substrate-binding protein [Fulvimarina pelagi]EAU42055.1 probable high-affinity zinc uptake system abc transporter protein [Fulvimarina pelagi HTCC2506]BAT31024.1 probable high-affinity zinc uptake system ABC transporter protein [Fulvimarina pelagi]
MRPIKAFFLASTFVTASAPAANAQVNVVASIKPVHSLVAAVMDGVGEPGLIVEGAGSPHTYAMKPSQAQMLEDAQLVFWIGPGIEPFLQKPLETIGTTAKTIQLMDSHDLVKLPLREGGTFEEHDHDHGGNEVEPVAAEGQEEHGHDHGHTETAKAGHSHDPDDGETAEAGHDHDQGETAEKGHDHDHGETAEAGHDHDYGEGEFNTHIWLDPVNAKAMVHEIEEALVAVDPDNAATYEANAEAEMARLDELVLEVSAQLEPLRDQTFIVFHDAYPYFENRFGVTAAGSITVSPEVVPGAQRVGEIQNKVEQLGATCVFAEPQFEPQLVSTVMEGTEARSGVLDPLGSNIENGPDLYHALIRNMAASMKDCLGQSS